MSKQPGLRTYGPTNPEHVKVTTEELGPLVPLRSNDIDQWTAKTGMILRVLVGSTVHGTAIEGQDDIDEMGIAVEPPRTTLGLDTFEHYVFRTAEPNGPVGGKSVISRPGDLDLVVYSLRKYAGLAARGNPTVLVPLFVTEDAVRYQTELGHELRANRDMFLSKQAGLRFKGYMHSQREGLMGLRSGGTRNQGRQDIRDKYGYDVKFAMHMLRLGYQGLELLRTGQISLPMKGHALRVCQRVRQGGETKDWCLAEAVMLEAHLEQAMKESRLPDAPSWDRINHWLVDAHLRHWGLGGTE
jgi:predicted nucleotidyltransferase